MSVSSFEPSSLLHYKTFPQEFFKIKPERRETSPPSGIKPKHIFLKHFMQSEHFAESKVWTMTVALRKEE